MVGMLSGFCACQEGDEFILIFDHREWSGAGVIRWGSWCLLIQPGQLHLLP